MLKCIYLHIYMIIILKRINFMHMCIYLHVYMFTTLVPCLRSPEESIRSLRTGLQMFVSCHTGAGYWTWFLWKRKSCPLTPEPVFRPGIRHFNNTLQHNPVKVMSTSGNCTQSKQWNVNTYWYPLETTVIEHLACPWSDRPH